MQKELVVLIHGFFKDKNDMKFLEVGLHVNNFKVLSANLPTTFERLSECVDSLANQINQEIACANSVHIVAHSMGGLIARAYIKKFNPENLKTSVFIATPHKGSALAEIANKIPLYSAIFESVKDLLPGKGINYFSKTKPFKMGLIAGNKGGDFLGDIFLNGSHDGRVEVSSVKASDADDFIEVPYNHQEIHQTMKVLE